LLYPTNTEVVFSFSLDSKNFLVSSLISLITCQLLSSVLFSLQVFEYFL
jgi:hypothetical protein